MHINVKFSNETDLKKLLDLLYEKSKTGNVFTGLLEAITDEVVIVTAIHNIKSNKGSKTTGVDKIKMDKYLQMPKDEVIYLVKKSICDYKPKPAKRVYIDKGNGKKRPLGIPTILDRIIQECIRIIIEPICEARFYPHSYGFRPYRSQKHAIRGIVNVINANYKSKDQPVWALEGDIKGCFDNINHRILLKKLWDIGVHDKRVIQIIKAMLSVGYVEYDMLKNDDKGTPQGGILSPLLANVYLNDFDWYVGRKYYEPHRKCKYKCNDSRRLKWSGITPKYNFRYADDWVILTSSKKEAERLKRELSKYFKYKLKLELSEEKTKITDMRTDGIHFLGFVIKAEKPRRTPADKEIKEHFVGKPYPDMKRLSKKIQNLCKEIRDIRNYSAVNSRIAQIQYINSVIMGIAEYIKIGISSHAFHVIDRRVNNSALSTWKRMYPDKYNEWQIPLKDLSNLPHRHEGYISKTFAIPYEDMWIGITMAFITHVRYEAKPFNQKMTPYTPEGRKIYVNYRNKNKPLPKDRPSINTSDDLRMAVYAENKMNFEYFMNREYAFNRDKGKCRCCKTPLYENPTANCHHVDNKLPIDKINKVNNLAWVCRSCHLMIHGSEIPESLDTKVVKKIEKFREKLKQAQK
ncbi:MULTISPECIES: group II intron reverse transcriptase/maturase [Bacillota]|uniref:group II intron reverse transcriptase/maturase n=1 Tax=Bacillota TaxID=1239 RepID=UPI00040A05BB|nr:MULTISPECIES: group II intron reverse transcriptase/maturase [Bacillota]MDO4662296.1 group II intron reverse transcriptase/maturase [Tissierellia bacterium]HBG6269827.1 group II intron reverse transcriptase/maturase [Clostridioides difficile]HEW2234971.1 group II intron reverse transcriptase/maturase [Streptococcus pneumoniae]MDB7984358.1 group II intron reverse transcriptase/maturase [Faecalicoccus pleomorphus]HBG6272396.1 group II intron reverse transcriptase/maturase [Clostridioides diff